MQRGLVRVPEQSRVPEASASGVRAAETGVNAGQAGTDVRVGVTLEKREARVFPSLRKKNALVKTSVSSGAWPAVDVKSTVPDKQRQQKAPATSQQMTTTNERKGERYMQLVQSR